MSRCLLMYAQPCSYAYPLFSICIFISLIPAYVYLNMYTHFPPLPYSYIIIAIFICMFCVVFCTYNHLSVFLLLFLQIQQTPMSRCLLMYTHNPAPMPILFFHLYLHFSNSCVYVTKQVFTFSLLFHKHTHLSICPCVWFV